MRTFRKYAFLMVLFFSLGSFECASTEAPVVDEITVVAHAPVLPVLRGLDLNPFLRVSVFVPDQARGLRVRSIHGTINQVALADIQRVDVYLTKFDEMPKGIPVASIIPTAAAIQIPVDLSFSSGAQSIWLSVVLKQTAEIDGVIEMHCTALMDDTGRKVMVAEDMSAFVKRKGVAIRKAGDFGVHTYRIPGIITTDRGTLIAVYDIRYKNSGDLPGNIDVGMSRSTDGGNTWEPMKIIMDMGAPHENNGVGDPCILFDPVTKKIWVAALWSKGNRSIAGSGPGLSPDETGQFVLASSSDDGLTWSETYTITPQIKNPVWKIFFQGPGAGIAMEDGTLVIPAQYWDPSGIPYSNLIYSKDHGKTWQTSLRAPKSNTTESQVVETTPGTLMLNMRDNRGQFRSVATTTDLGSTWKEHATSYSALPDPVCMGSLIQTTVSHQGAMRKVLFFCNPDKSAAPREKTTIKASLDLGESWPAAHHLLIDVRNCYGYSSMAMIDQNTIGLLYEGIQDLYFVKVPVKELLP